MITDSAKPNQSQVTDDPRLATVIKEGINGEIVIVGFPYDIGAKRINKIYGQDNGPDCLRRFLPKAGPAYNAEYDIDISTMKIVDYGNIVLNVEKEKITLEDLLDKLGQKVNRIRKNNGLPFVIGGTKDQIYGCLHGLKDIDISNTKAFGIINIHNSCDLNKLYQGDKIDQSCATRKFILDQGKKGLKVVYFASQNNNISKEASDFVENNKEIIEIIKLEDIRKSKSMNFESSLGKPLTQAGQNYSETLDCLSNKVDAIHLSITLEAINSCFCPGVGQPSVIGGLTCEEIIEIMYISGECKKIVSIDISDYNPNVEDFRTGRLLSNMFYYFLLGRKKY